jgi:dTMP kinase
MDLGLSDNTVTSFRLFQRRIIDEYEEMITEFGFTVIDGTLPIQVQQRRVRRVARKILQDWRGLPIPDQIAGGD